MKKDLQPNYGKATIRCVCGNVIETSSLDKNKQYLAKVELLNSWKNTELNQNNLNKLSTLGYSFLYCI